MIPYILATIGGYFIGSSMSDSYEEGGVMAKGGIVVTKIKDIPNLMEEVDAGRVTYRGLGMGKLSNDFYKLTGEGGKKIKVNGKEYFITDEEFRKLDWDDKKGQWKNKIKFSAPKRKFEEGGEMAGGGQVKWQDAMVGDSARVIAENKMGLIFSTYGRKFNLRFVDGKEKTYDASELEFYKD